MCFKNCKWFHKPDPVTTDPIPTGVKKTALLFAINDYPGSANDLNGCLNDQRDITNFLSVNYPDFVVKKFSDSEVTRSNFMTQCKNQILSLSIGDELLVGYSGHGTYGTDPNGTEQDGYIEALYLYDGPFWDYEFKGILQLIPDGAKVIVALDSCFSAGSTKLFKENVKPRYVQTQEIDPSIKIRRSFVKADDMKYILFAGCGERQTSADAYINNEYHGAFTYYWLKAWEETFKYRQWNEKTVNLIAQTNEYDQIPEIIGNENLSNQIIFT
jgi:hypothetical protein